MSTAAEPAALRRDAQRNLDRVMAEAERLFAERGSDVSIAEVAAAAGVGKATVYRSFPTKDHLLEAVALERHRWFADRIDAALAEPSAWVAFEAFVHDLSARLERDRTLAQVMREAHARPALKAVKATTLEAFQALVDRAIAEGTMRPGARCTDVASLVSGYSTALTNAGASAEDWERLAGLVVDAYRVR